MISINNYKGPKCTLIIYNDKCIKISGMEFKKPNIWFRFWHKVLLNWTWEDYNV